MYIKQVSYVETTRHDMTRSTVNDVSKNILHKLTNTRLLTTKYKIRVMLGHYLRLNYCFKIVIIIY